MLETGKVILESAILTTVVVLSLTFYTFWAAKKGYDFNFLGPFLFGAIIVLIVFGLIQVITIGLTFECNKNTKLISLWSGCESRSWGWKYELDLWFCVQILFPLGRISVMIYGCLASIIFCGYIVYDTDNLIKRYSYDEYIWAAVSLYLDIINLFLSLLTIFRAADS